MDSPVSPIANTSGDSLANAGGPVAQLVERHDGIVEVRGSNPRRSTDVTSARTIGVLSPADVEQCRSDLLRLGSLLEIRVGSHF